MRGGQSANGKVTRARSRKSQRSPNSRGQRSQDAMVVTAFPVLQGRRRGHAGTSSWALEEGGRTPPTEPKGGHLHVPCPVLAWPGG